ncbi:MAG TPA: hypothetical protein VF812_02230 [Ktedonobacterales bacterium]
MEHEVPPPPSHPPHDTLQRLLRPALDPRLGAVLVVLWPLTLGATLALVLVSLLFSPTLAILTPTVYLFHLWMAVTTLIFLRGAIISPVSERSPMRLSPALLRALAQQAPRRPGADWRAAWTGVWFAVYFGVCAILLPWPPLPHAIPPSALLLGAALPIVLIVALAPNWRRGKST